mmetsp:Transcript_27658/g.69307  ORF Transcript_27658/g.69307 Transcript_27658/m.69307 type:complete len:136 (-) Transcript_27658:955-1362(-)|eukprot:CAMPEP_0181373900 /NCGR_PEP_ID=MMETSP1106-20121128/15671_1 /TAXON_ID=81844 /ORGANISM="Mantoniella antarctica, Strain SL-175" /LENGTH=135 /DNA_ID=CAMNT_0023491721 /DNA_START=24 /DNA_END=431 /DNA_ORIENTATION=-
MSASTCCVPQAAALSVPRRAVAARTSLAPSVRAPHRCPAGVRCRATEQNTSAASPPVSGPVDDAESREVLDAFFIGKALAETLLERAGGVLADTLSEVARFDAERREQIRDFQDDVMGKAREEMYRAKRDESQIR